MRFGLTINFRRLILVMTGLLIFTSLAAGLLLWHLAFRNNINTDCLQSKHLYIPTGSQYEDVLNILEAGNCLINVKSFDRLARRKNYPRQVKPGRYLIKGPLGNNELINILRSGRQDPLRLSFHNLRTRYQLAGHFAQMLEADSAEIVRLMNDKDFLEQFGLDPQTATVLFIPNTYEFYWNTSAREVFERMHREFRRFWNAERRASAERLGLDPVEVHILASIVQAETSRYDEMPRIAGVYLNRLKRNMPLQADPTVVFALGDFSISRVLSRHLEIDSPFNTYRYSGLPPGPINLPENRTLEAVLKAESHEYLFFCARDDFSGYHAFARTYTEHLQNARRYRQALDQRGIR